MDPLELQTLYTIMETLSSDQKWRTTYPSPCTPSTSWVGSVKDSHFHVTRLDFDTPPNPICKKTATFPSQIFQLPYLQSIFFFQCFTKTKTTISILVVTIPSQLFTHLSSLQIFTLSQSKISGKIPPEIFKMITLVHQRSPSPTTTTRTITSLHHHHHHFTITNITQPPSTTHRSGAIFNQAIPMVNI